MQNAAPDSPRLRPALAGLALALVAAVAPAAAEEAGAPAPAGLPRLLRAGNARHALPERWSVWPTTLELHLGRGEPLAPVGLAFRLAEGVTVGAAGSFDAERDEAIGLLVLQLAF